MSSKHTKVGVNAVGYRETCCTIPQKPKTKIKMRTSIEHGEARCVICRNAWRISLNILWTKRLLPQVGKHSTFAHFPKDRHCEVCKRTKITRAPCRRRTGNPVPRAEKFVDLITAGHRVLSEECESRNNHRYAVVVQDLATQRIQSYPCKTQTSQETEQSVRKFLESIATPQVIHTRNSLEFGRACEELSWNHCTFTPHRSETNGTAERAVHRLKEGTSAVLLQ